MIGDDDRTRGKLTAPRAGSPPRRNGLRKYCGKLNLFVSVPRRPMSGSEFFWNSMRGGRSSRASAYGDA
jgi:hypothetical protein